MRLFLTTIFAAITLFATPAWCGGPYASCCSLNAKECADPNWCPHAYNQYDCTDCSNDLIWLKRFPNGECAPRWDSCTHDYSACCRKLNCIGQDGYDLTGLPQDPDVEYAQCLYLGPH